MATTSARRTRTVRVHGTELSTDGELFGPYAETMAVLIALIGVLAAAWVVATPSEGADLPAAEANVESTQTAPGVYTVRRTSDSSADVLWADAFDAPRATAVTVVPRASAAPADEPVEVATPALG